MKVTWLGHACFLLEAEGYRIVVDPYTGVDGYPELHVQAHEIWCSHQHSDHNAVGAVEALPKQKSPFTVRTVHAFHDPKRGALRGTSDIRIFTADGVSVAHLGDLGHLLSDAQVREIGALDVALIPVGGYYTIDSAQAKTVLEQLRPRCAVPMHYRHGSCGLPVIAELDTFLAQYSPEQIHRLPDCSFDVTADLSGILVPTWKQ